MDENTQSAERSSSARRLLLGRHGVPILMVALLIGVSGGVYWQSTLYPKRLSAVVDGKLYRSGEVTPAQLARLRDELGIERVVCLLNPAEPVTQREREAAQELGIEWRNIGLTGDGASDAAERGRLLEVLTEPNAPPTLVHCAAGVNRTGLAVGLYRIHVQGWSYDDVLAEMKEFDFEDLPKHENLRSALRAAANPATTQPAP